MEYEKLLTDLGGRIKLAKGLSIFVEQSSKFENWLQVELAGILLDHCPNIRPEVKIEKERGEGEIYCDIADDNIKIELKLLRMEKSTKYDVNGIIGDFKKLHEYGEKNKKRVIIFLAFPVEINNDKWKKRREEIEVGIKTYGRLEGDPVVVQFKNRQGENGKEGLLCFGRVND